MTTEAWLAFATTAAALLLAPHPLAFTVATYARSWGRTSAFVTVPSVTLAVTIAAIIATAASIGLFTVMPAIDDAVSWVGLAFLIIYCLYAFQDPRLRQSVADNDNLPETRPLKICWQIIRTAFQSGRYVFLMAAVLAQFSEPAAVLPLDYAAMIGVLAGAAFISALCYAVFPRLMRRKRRPTRKSGKAPHKPGTLFIARRAVTAGYRRIAA